MLQPQTIGIILNMWILVAWALWFPQFNKLHPMAGSFILAMHATDHRFCSIRRIVGHASKREMVDIDSNHFRKRPSARRSHVTFNINVSKMCPSAQLM